MALVKCKACGTDMSAKAATCPKCGEPNPRSNHLSGGQVVGALALAGVGLWWYAGGGMDHQVAQDMSKIEDQVAQDAVNQYNIAVRQGDAMQICVQAGLVSAAYLQAKDEPNYQTWKRAEQKDCKRAGVQQ